jgi:hypothetical protein
MSFDQLFDVVALNLGYVLLWSGCCLVVVLFGVGLWTGARWLRKRIK